MVATASITDWLDTHAHALRTLDPNDNDFSDLEPLRGIIGDARVVTIGESAHLQHEFLLLRDRLVRFLMSELGFTGFALESGLSEGLLVHDWVLGADGDVADVARRGITYGFGQCEETRALLRWMREWNESHDRKVRYYGMDLCGGSGSMEPAVLYTLNYLDRVDPEYATSVREKITPLMKGFRRDGNVQAQTAFGELNQADKERILLLVTELAGRMSSGRIRYARLTSRKAAELALRAAINARQTTLALIALPTMFGPGDKLNVRDAAMRENIEWILQHEDRLIVAAHNGHIQRAPLGYRDTRTDTMGEHLAAIEGLSMVVIGTTYAAGEVIKFDMPEGADRTAMRMYFGELNPPPAGTIDALMDQAGPDLYLLDLKTVPDSGLVAEAFRDATGMYVNENVVTVDPLAAFDALIHVRRVSMAEADDEIWSSVERREK